MKLLAFDSSTATVSVAAGDGTTWHVRDEHAGSANSERILPLVRVVLDEAGWALGDLDGIAFGAGPGAFTGVRIACGVAQGLALGAELPLVPVPTLEALAQEARRRHGAQRVFACLDARMREVYVAAYESAAEGWRIVNAPDVQRPDAVTAPEGIGWFGAGDGFALYPALAGRLALERVDATVRPTAVSIGELAAPRFAAGDGVPAFEALPLYVRHKVALTSAERAAGARL